MGKGSGRRPSSISRSDMASKWDAAFGPRAIETAATPRSAYHEEDQQLRDQAYCAYCHRPVEGPEFSVCTGCAKCLEDDRIMDPVEAKSERDPYWIKSSHRGEYTCPCGVGHGNHVHGCCGKSCCSRPDYPLRGVKTNESK